MPTSEPTAMDRAVGRAACWAVILMLAAVPLVGGLTESWIATGVVAAATAVAGVTMAFVARRLADPAGRGLDERQRAERRGAFVSIYWAVVLVMVSAVVTLWLLDVGGVPAAAIAFSSLGTVLFLPTFATALDLRREPSDG